jgi:hypothetical protein
MALSDFDAINVSDQVAISANPTGIGPPIPIPLPFNPLSGFLHVSSSCLLGNPLAFPAPLGNVLITRSSSALLKTAPMLYVRGFPDSPPTPMDVTIGDPVGPVGVSVNSTTISILNASTISVISPTTFWEGIKNLIGAETITGAKAQTGAEARSGGKTINGATVINGSLDVVGRLTCSNVSLVGTINVQGWKEFDIPHPTKPNHRLSHACIEGPEIGVYYRGRLNNESVINLPEYWRGLVDAESITVQLTPHGCYQELYVKEIQWGTKIVIVNNSGGPIDCSYVIFGKRKDVPDLEVEYVGTEMKGGK